MAAYDQSIFIPEILEWIEKGKTLRSYCRQDGKPSYGAIYDWLEENTDFASRFARARLCGFDQIADECLEIADTEKDANIGKLRVWTRTQLLAKWNPKKYGDKVELSGEVAVKRVVTDI